MKKAQSDVSSCGGTNRRGDQRLKTNEEEAGPIFFLLIKHEMEENRGKKKGKEKNGKNVGWIDAFFLCYRFFFLPASDTDDAGAHPMCRGTHTSTVLRVSEEQMADSKSLRQYNEKNFSTKAVVVGEKYRCLTGREDAEHNSTHKKKRSTKVEKEDKKKPYQTSVSAV